MFDNLNAAGRIAGRVVNRDATCIGHHIVFATLEAAVERAVGQVVVYGRLIDGHLTDAIKAKRNQC